MFCCSSAWYPLICKIKGYQAWCWYIKTYKTGWLCLGKCRSIFQHHGSHMGITLYTKKNNVGQYTIHGVYGYYGILLYAPMSKMHLPLPHGPRGDVHPIGPDLTLVISGWILVTKSRPGTILTLGFRGHWGGERGDFSRSLFFFFSTIITRLSNWRIYN